MMSDWIVYLLELENHLIDCFLTYSVVDTSYQRDLRMGCHLLWDQCVRALLPLNFDIL